MKQLKHALAMAASAIVIAATPAAAERLASGPPLAYRAAKAAVVEGANLSLESALDLEARNQRVVGRSRDVREGVKAFLEKRKPRFKGE